MTSNHFRVLKLNRIRNLAILVFAGVVAIVQVYSLGLAQTGAVTFTVAQGLDARSLSPLSSTTHQEKNVSNQIVERLVQFTKDGSDFEPILATAWEMVADDTLRLHLREGVWFTNGEPFNSEAAVFALTEFMNAPAYQSFADMLYHAEAVDEYTVDLQTAAPASERLILNALAMGGFMYPPIYTAEVGILDGFSTQPIGTGPFVFREWVRDDRIVLEANSDYWGGKPGVDRLVFRAIPEGAARAAALEAGDIDFAIDLPLDAFNRIDRLQDVEAVSAIGGRVFMVFYAALEQWPGPANNAEVRRALRHAIDVEGIVEHILQGHGQVLQGQVLPDWSFGFNPDLETIEYNPDLARELLAAAGYPNGLDLRFRYSAGRYILDRQIGELISAQLEEVGVRVNQDVLEPGAFLQEILYEQKGNDMSYVGLLTPPDPHYMYVQFQSGFRYAYWSSPEFDELIEQGLYTIDSAERRATYMRMAEILNSEAAVLPLFIPNDIYGYRSNVSGWEPSVDQYLDFRVVTKN